VDIISRLAGAGDEEPESWIGTATVTNASAGTFPDGRRRITVNWQGALFDCGYLASYTPAVGDNVSFLKAGPSFLVLGEPAR
jgi:hypothetical protein